MEMTISKVRKRKAEVSAHLPPKKKAICEKHNNVNLEGLYTADCIDYMAAMPDGCVDLVVTSPPL